MAKHTVKRFYYYRGGVERWRHASQSYRWSRGYSAYSKAGSVLYPWMTSAECRDEARRDGVTPVFIEEEGEV